MTKKLKPAETEREWWALLRSKDTTFIRSIKDWQAAIADPKNNPLKGCDSEAIAHFTESLKFKKGGLAHTDYSAVVKQLNFLQFTELWERFGLSLRLIIDYKDMRCEGSGTCAPINQKICTSNCWMG